MIKKAPDKDQSNRAIVLPQDIDIVILDAYSLLFRAYHSFPLSLQSPDGEITNAVYGFTRMLLRVLEIVDPKYIVTGTDMGEPTFRHQTYTQYKANREEADPELKAQFPLMYAVLEVLNIPTIGINGYEADDVIGTLSEKLSHSNPELKVAIFTSDRDTFQLIHDNVYVLWPERDGSGDLRVIDKQAVEDHFGVKVDQVIDYKALCGDPSDNIPGVKGVGPKTAVQLLTEFGSIARLYQALMLASKINSSSHLNQAEIKKKFSKSERVQLISKVKDLRPAVIKKLVDSQEEAWLSQELAKIDTDVPLDFSLEQAKLCDYDKTSALELFTQLGFESLKRKLPSDSFENQVQTSLFG